MVTIKPFMILWFFICIWPMPSQDAKKSQEELRRDTIRYGTDTEILALMTTLANEKLDYLDDDLADIAETTRNGKILVGAFNFFGERKKPGLEARAELALQERDNESNDTVEAAIAYMGKMGYSDGQDTIREIIDSGEQRFAPIAVRSLGLIGGGESADANSEFLCALFDEGDTSDDTKREILISLGELKSTKAVAFLKAFAENADNRVVQRMVALESIAKIRDETGLSAVLSSLSDADPNVRAVAVASLGPFSGTAVDAAILEAFRDSFYKTRIAACKAAKERSLVAAIPYLRYRVERDEVPAVKDEALRALAGIGNDESKAIIHGQFKDQRNADKVRILAAELLIALDPNAYGVELIAEMDDAKTKKRTALYNGFAKTISQAATGSTLNLAQRFFTSGDIVEKNYALDMVRINKLKELEKEVRTLAEDKNESLARKAKETLGALGLK